MVSVARWAPRLTRAGHQTPANEKRAFFSKVTYPIADRLRRELLNWVLHLTLKSYTPPKKGELHKYQDVPGMGICR
jgi:hypothetical protein